MSTGTHSVLFLPGAVCFTCQTESVVLARCGLGYVIVFRLFFLGPGCVLLSMMGWSGGYATAAEGT